MFNLTFGDYESLVDSVSVGGGTSGNSGNNIIIIDIFCIATCAIGAAGTIYIAH